MRLVIPTTGSRGDVQPYIALGQGLQAAGHDVCIATHGDFGDAIRSRGLDFYPVEDDSRALHASEIGLRMMEAGGNPFKFIRELSRLRVSLMERLMVGCWEASEGADAVLVSMMAYFPGFSAAEKRGIPAIGLSLQPTTPSRLLASCFFPALPRGLPLRGTYNLLSHLIVGESFWQLLRKTVNRTRQEVLGLPPVPFFGPPLSQMRGTPTLYGFSPRLVGRPRDWSANHHITGFWFLDAEADWTPPDDLVDFLDAGPPPVCVGFGSMGHADPQAMTDLVVEALELAGQRGILLSGWGGLSTRPPSDRIFVTEAVPHDWLFTRVSAVVHHGGLGTTAAGLRAGLPTVVVPHMADQPFWGRRVFELGVGPRPIPRKRLTPQRLAEAIRLATTDRALWARAVALGRQLRLEDGVARAVDHIEAILAGRLSRTAVRAGPRQLVAAGADA